MLLAGQSVELFELPAKRNANAGPRIGNTKTTAGVTVPAVVFIRQPRCKRSLRGEDRPKPDYG